MMAKFTEHRIDRFPLVRMAHRIEAMADTPLRRLIERVIRECCDRLDVLDTDPTFSLDRLEAQMQLMDGIDQSRLLTDDDYRLSERRRDIGRALAGLHMRIFGVGVKGRAYGYRTPDDPDDLLARLAERERRLKSGEPDLTPDQRRWLDEARYKALLGAVRRMERAGARSNKRRAIEALVIAVCIDNRVPVQANFRDLRRGLDAMLAAEMPSADDAIKADEAARKTARTLCNSPSDEAA